MIAKELIALLSQMDPYKQVVVSDGVLAETGGPVTGVFGDDLVPEVTIYFSPSVDVEEEE